MRIKTNIGFDGRMFLTREEYNTYLRRKPVRYIRKKLDTICVICGLEPTSGNPLQNAHKIGFEMGLVYLGLTPEYVDNHNNIVSAHRTSCNQMAELSLEDSMRFLYKSGVKELPSYLSKEILNLFDEIKQ